MKAKDNGVKYEVLIQYDGLESNLTEIYERVKKTYVDAGHDAETFKEIVKNNHVKLLIKNICQSQYYYFCNKH